MQTLVQPPPGIRGKDLPADNYVGPLVNRVTGLRQKFIRRLIWLNILFVALRIFRSPIKALKRVRALKALRSRYRNDKPLHKYAKSGNRYFVNFNTPGWPSRAFNRYVGHHLRRHGNIEGNSLSTLIFAITKKCGFQCEHCCEWLNLNKPETLSREDLLSIVNGFQLLGIAQVQLSGGEPLNRYRDILFLLDNAPKGVDFWIYTTGHSLNAQKARQLKRRGLTGITISLDHHRAVEHNAFRGVSDAYQKAMAATAFARNAGLATCFSLCATKAFISEENLSQYMELARRMGVSFVQVLEPKAVGHYAGMDVGITIENQTLIESFYQKYNYDPAYKSYPAIAYHGYTTREFGCTGSGADYVYADTDGDVHNCPFCQRKLFSALDPSLPQLIQKMKTKGCSAFSSCSTKN